VRDAGSRAVGGRGAIPARVLAFWSAAVAVLLLSVGFIAYRKFLHYERHAIEHVPAGSELALRLDLEQVVLFEPLRRHLLPLIDQAPLTGAPPERGAPSRLLRLREQAGLNLAFDLRELVFAREPAGGWVLALGGMFGTSAVLDGIEGVLNGEPGMQSSRAAGVLTLSGSGLALAQADDGVLLIASDAAVLARSLPASRAYEALGVGGDGAGALGALGSWLEPHARGAAGGPPLTRCSARLELDDPLIVTAWVVRAGRGDVAAARRDVAGWLGIPSTSDDFAPRPDWAGERALLARASFVAESETAVRVSTTWQRAELDLAARSLASWLESRFATGGPSAQ
jgi:hypothetical protein